MTIFALHIKCTTQCKILFCAKTILWQIHAIWSSPSQERSSQTGRLIWLFGDLLIRDTLLRIYFQCTSIVEKGLCRGVVYWTVLCYHPNLVSYFCHSAISASYQPLCENGRFWCAPVLGDTKLPGIGSRVVVLSTESVSSIFHMAQ